jgi:hypothetical protein
MVRAWLGFWMPLDEGAKEHADSFTLLSASAAEAPEQRKPSTSRVMRRT